MAMRTFGCALVGVSLVLVVGCGGGRGHSSDGSAEATPTVVAAATPIPTQTAPPALAFAVGGALASRSDDGGGSWRDVLATDTTLWGVDFVNRSTGWVVGVHHIFRTDSGGQDARGWASQDANVSGATPDLYDVAFRDVDHGVAVGAAPRFGESGVIVTSDGGAHWRLIDLSRLDLRYRMWPTRVCLAADGRGIAVGNGFSRGLPPLALTTIDAGETWSDATEGVRKVAPFGRAESLAACASAGGDLWVAGEPSFLARSDDGGEVWTRIPVTMRASVRLIAVLFLDREHGWVAGYDLSTQDILVFVTDDGGASWQEQVLLRGVFILGQPPSAAFAALDAESLVLVGTDPNSFRLEGPRPFSFTSHDGGRSWIPSTIPAGYQSFVDVAIVR